MSAAKISRGYWANDAIINRTIKFTLTLAESFGYSQIKDMAYYEKIIRPKKDPELNSG